MHLEDDAKKPFGTNSRFRVSYRLRFCDRERGNFLQSGASLLGYVSIRDELDFDCEV